MRNGNKFTSRTDGSVKLLALAALVAGALAIVAVERSSGGPDVSPSAPEHLADTGLYTDFAGKVVAAGNYTYEPQYPLWSDGAAKRRWIYLPPGTTIDATDPGHWRFPAGTKFWKEFSFGRRVETRYMEAIKGDEWIYATYVWTEDGSDAVLAPERGIRGVAEIRDGVRHDVPGRYDCMACHEGQPNRVLGFSALQLSPDRDPLAPHAQKPAPDGIDLEWLHSRGLLHGIPESFFEHPPRIEAATPVARAALGYLHANCGGCHNGSGPLAELRFSLEALVATDGWTVSRAPFTAVGEPSGYRPPGRAQESLMRIAAGDPANSVILERMSSRDPSVQMPPLGTHLVDEDAVRLITSWIRDGLGPRVVHLSQLEH